MKSRGVTLVELLIVLLLAAILFSAAMPAMHGILQRLRLRAATNDLAAAIDLTRSQAIARGGKVMLAPLDPVIGWRQGWAVFIDQNSNRRPDPGELLLYRHDPIAQDMQILSSFSSNAGLPYLAYNAAGRACSADNSLAARWGTLSLTQGKQARNIKINMLGRVRVCDPAQDKSCSGVND